MMLYEGNCHVQTHLLCFLQIVEHHYLDSNLLSTNHGEGQVKRDKEWLEDKQLWRKREVQNYWNPPFSNPLVTSWYHYYQHHFLIAASYHDMMAAMLDDKTIKSLFIRAFDSFSCDIIALILPSNMAALIWWCKTVISNTFWYPQFSA